jgi:hypothetical protein
MAQPDFDQARFIAALTRQLFAVMVITTALYVGWRALG